MSSSDFTPGTADDRTLSKGCQLPNLWEPTPKKCRPYSADQDW